MEKIKYKVIQFKCSCKYIWLDNTERQKGGCPEHGRPILKYILWCDRCGIKVTANPWAGYRQEVCRNCRRLIINETSKKWAEDHPGYHKKKKKPKKKKNITQKEVFSTYYGEKQESPQGRCEANIIIAQCFEDLRRKCVPPKEGMI